MEGSVDRSEVPPSAFTDPVGADEGPPREFVESAVDALLTACASAGDRSPLPADPAVPSAEIPETGRPPRALIDDLETLIEGSMNPAHPGYVGHMDTVPATASVVGDAVAAAINNNMLSVELSPVCSALEAGLIETVADAFGLGPEAGGVLTSGGSLANLQALAVARNRAFDVDAGNSGESDVDVKREGLVGVDARPVVLVSEVAHTSIRKAAMLLGLGTDAVVPVETDANDRLRPDALARTIDRLREEDAAPFCVVATAGTTTTGNVDPIDAIADVAADGDLWCHVDAAYGGALVLSDRHRDRLAGIERADSVTFNPQKWWYVAKTCAMALFADESVLDESFRIGAPYMRDDGVRNRGEVSIQGTRHADAIKLWLTIRQLGRRGLESLIDGSHRLAHRLYEGVTERSALEAATEPETNVVCFRAAPEWRPPETRDDLNDRLQRRLLRDHDVFVSLPTYRGERWLRTVLLNPFTDESVVDRLLAGIDETLHADRVRWEREERE